MHLACIGFSGLMVRFARSRHHPLGSTRTPPGAVSAPFVLSHHMQLEFVMDLSFIVPFAIVCIFAFLIREWRKQSSAYTKEQERQLKLAEAAQPVLVQRAEELHQVKLREISIKEADLAHRMEVNALDRADRQLDREARQSEADRAFDQRVQGEAHASALARINATSGLALAQRRAALDDIKILKEGGTLPSLQVPADLVATTLIVEEALPSPEAVELEQEVFNIVVDNREIVLTYVPALKMGRYGGAVNRDFFECSKEQLAQEAMAKAMSL